jgi:phosphoribosylformylglycinamidine synthase
MPHPERVFRSIQMSWRPDRWSVGQDPAGPQEAWELPGSSGPKRGWPGEDSPWMRLFRNARVWVG